MTPSSDFIAGRAPAGGHLLSRQRARTNIPGDRSRSTQGGVGRTSTSRYATEAMFTRFCQGLSHASTAGRERYGIGLATVGEIEVDVRRGSDVPTDAARHATTGRGDEMRLEVGGSQHR